MPSGDRRRVPPCPSGLGRHRLWKHAPQDFCVFPGACDPECGMCVLPHFSLDPALSLRNPLDQAHPKTSGTKICGSDT